MIPRLVGEDHGVGQEDNGVVVGVWIRDFDKFGELYRRCY